MRRQAKPLFARSRGRSRQRLRTRSWLLAALSSALLTLGFAGSAQAANVFPSYGEIDGSNTPAGSFGQLYPESVAVNGANGHVLVADSGASVLYEFDAAGAYLATWNGSATPAGSFEGRVSVAANDTTGDVYVTDAGHRVVNVFDSAGNYLATWNGSATPAGSFAADSPRGVAVDQASGDVYVADPGNQVVDVFDASGTYLSQVTGSPDITLSENYADGLAVNGANGHLYVADSGPVVTYEFDALGGYLKTFDGANTPDGSFGGFYTTVAANNASGVVYVTDTQHEVIDLFDSSGAYLDQITGLGNGCGPTGLSVDQESGKVFTSWCNTVKIFGGTRLVIPDVVTEAATDTDETSTILHGSLDPAGGGDVTECYFEYGADTHYGQKVPCVPAAPFSSPTEVSADISGLAGGVTYHYRLVAGNVDGPNQGADRTFKTAVAPVAETLPAAPRTTTTARLNAEVDAQSVPTTYYFEWGTDTSYGNSAPVSQDASAGSEDETVIVSAEIASLQPNTTYHYRVVAVNSAGTDLGEDMTMRTRTEAEMALEPRGIELVTPPSTGGQTPLGALAASGGKVVWATAFASAPGSSTGGGSAFIASRTPTGWKSRTMIPPVEELIGGGTETYDLIAGGIAADFSQATFQVNRHGSLAPKTFVLVDQADYHQTQLLTVAGSTNVAGFGTTASNSGGHVFVVADDEQIGTPDPGHLPGTKNVYDLKDGTLVSRLPDGSVPPCGVSFEIEANSRNWFGGDGLSDDGTKAIFAAEGNACDLPEQLYLRDLDAASTTLISAPSLEGPLEKATFIALDRAGSTVIFVTATKLDSADENTGNDIYRWTEADGNTCLTCVVPNARVITGGGNDDETNSHIFVSEDFSHIYFNSAEQLVPGKGEPGVRSTYVWHDGAIKYVSALRELADSDSFAATTPTGNVLLFMSNQAGLTTDALGTCFSPGEIRCWHGYLYDADAGSLECVTCPVGGGDPDGSNTALREGTSLVEQTVLADDGGTVAFTSRAALIPRDVNGVTDVYEWHNGRLRLVTDGVTEFPDGPGEPQMLGVSRDGVDLVFSVQKQLTGYEEDQAVQIYDARLGGGFGSPPTPPAPCIEDACQGPLQAPPPQSNSGSATFAGPGNASPRSKARHKKRHKKKRHGKRRKANTQQAKSRRG